MTKHSTIADTKARYRSFTNLHGVKPQATERSEKVEKIPELTEKFKYKLLFYYY